MSRIEDERIDAAERRRAPQKPRRSAASVAGSIALDVAALAGAVCIVLVVLAYGFHVTLIMFKTGSMSPTIPAGSLALVHEIPASDIAVGDVVTVDRPGQLPVTHRVTSVGPGETDDARSITLKGDANTTEDPAPYEVSHVRVVWASVPGLAHVVIWLSHPWILAALTFGCSALVTWAFWPRSRRRRPPPPRRRKSRERHVAHVAAVALAIGGGAAVSGAATPAHAAPRTSVVTGTALVLTTIGDPSAMTTLGPGDSTPWEVGIATKPTAGPGSIDVSVTWTGSAELGLIVSAEACTEQWTRDGCRGRSTRLIDAAPAPVDSTPRALLSMSSQQGRWVRFEVTVPADPGDGQGSAALTVTANGLGDDLSSSSGSASALAATGGNGDQAVGLSACAVIAGVLGAGLVAAQRGRTARSRV
ncbi:signal peptidase I [Microbacterium sp. P03]|uniref:signal peptidase I n=1 Tax=Microbacterium sp. P03 TaxID=3366946 RepID=UPI0037451D54